MRASTHNSDPHHHTANIERMLEELVTHLRNDVEQVEEPKAQALFETAAEVLQGLKTAFSHYDTGSEPGMRR